MATVCLSSLCLEPLLYSLSSFPTTSYVPLNCLETILFLYLLPSFFSPTPSCCKQSSLHSQLTDIQFLNGSTMSVWERDGNIQYLTGKHIPLFVFAVAVLVLLWFPFTLVLVSIQWLQKRNTLQSACYWVNKLTTLL